MTRPPRPETYPIDFVCKCGTRPNWWITIEEMERHATRPHDWPIGTWRCPNPRCGRTHVIRAGHCRMVG